MSEQISLAEEVIKQRNGSTFSGTYLLLTIVIVTILGVACAGIGLFVLLSYCVGHKKKMPAIRPQNSRNGDRIQVQEPRRMRPQYIQDRAPPTYHTYPMELQQHNAEFLCEGNNSEQPPRYTEIDYL